MVSSIVQNFASRRQMDLSIARAIFEAAGQDAESAVRIADEPTAAQKFLISNRAFKIAGSRVQTLEWGLRSDELATLGEESSHG